MLGDDEKERREKKKKIETNLGRRSSREHELSSWIRLNLVGHENGDVELLLEGEAEADVRTKKGRRRADATRRTSASCRDDSDEGTAKESARF